MIRNIHPTADIHETAVIIGSVLIGPNVTIHPYCVIGDCAESYDLQTNDLTVEIEENTVLREHVVVQRGLDGGGGTSIGRNCYIMHGSHVAHDVFLESNVTLSPFTVLGGHTRVMQGATLGIHSATHQFVTVGAYAMLGMGSMAIDDIPPGVVAMGSPARVTGHNKVGIDRAGVNETMLADLTGIWEARRNRREAKPR